MRRSLGLGAAAYIAVAAVIAPAGGIISALPTGMLVGFIIYAAFGALVHELIVGLAAMHSGWFPICGRNEPSSTRATSNARSSANRPSGSEV